MPKRNSTEPRRHRSVRFGWTAALMIAEGPRKGEPSTKIMRNGSYTQPAPLVRGSSRRIMSLRFRPAYISVINRRASAEAVISPAVQKEPRGTKPTVSFPLGIPILPSTAKAAERRCCSYNRKLLKAHQQEHVPAPPPVGAVSAPERCSPSRVRFAAPHYGAPLTAPRRSGQVAIGTGGS